MLASVHFLVLLGVYILFHFDELSLDVLLLLVSVLAVLRGEDGLILLPGLALEFLRFLKRVPALGGSLAILRLDQLCLETVVKLVIFNFHQLDGLLVLGLLILLLRCLTCLLLLLRGLWLLGQQMRVLLACRSLDTSLLTMLSLQLL